MENKIFNKTKKILVVVFSLLLMISTLGFVFDKVGVFADSKPISLTFSSDELKYAFNKTSGISGDSKTGVLLTSKQSGTNVQGTDFSLGNFAGSDFEVDFRVVSEKIYTFGSDATQKQYTHTLKHDVKDATGYANLARYMFDDNYNPYSDVKEISFTFTSNSNPNMWFKLHILGNGGNGSGVGIYVPSCWVEINNETQHVYSSETTYGDSSYIYDNNYQKVYGYGLVNGAYTDNGGAGIGDSTFTKIYGTSFSNYYSNSDGSLAAPTSNLVKFDVENMCVYVNNSGTYSVQNTVANTLVRNLATNAGYTGSDPNRTVSTLDKSYFTSGYSVDITVERMIANDFASNSSDLSSKVYNYGQRYQDTTAYDRYANMLLYSLNGINFTESNVEIHDVLFDEYDVRYGEDTTVDFHTQAQKDYIADYTQVASYASGVAELSKPNKIAVIWNNYGSGANSYEFRLSEHENMQDYVSYNTLSQKIKLENLKVATKYYWQVKAIYTGSTSLSNISTFSTEETVIRNLNVDGLTNVRDVGGYEMSSGGRVNQGLIYRTSRLNENNSTAELITATGKNTLLNDLKVKTEIDLRRTRNNESGNMGQSVLTGVKYYACPMEYAYDFLAENRDQIIKLFEILGKEENYPVIIHCSIGTDRTGMVSYLINALLGVNQDGLYTDYLFSNFGKIGGARTIAGIENKYVKTLNNYSGDTLQEKTFNYLVDIGVSKADIYTLINVMSGANIEIGTNSRSTSLLTSLNSVTATSYTSTIDGRSGIKVSSIKSGVEAEGSGFSFADNFVGDFELDFRVFSQNTFVTADSNKTISHGIAEYLGENKSRFMFNDNMNPYNDLQEIVFKFTSNVDSDKWFKVHIRGVSSSEVFATYTTCAWVEVNGDNTFTYNKFSGKPSDFGLDDSYSYLFGKTPDQIKGYGLRSGTHYDSWGTTKEDYAYTSIYGTSFSNYMAISASEVGATPTSNIVRFDPETMCVYVNASNTYLIKNDKADTLVRNMKTNEGYTAQEGSTYQATSLSSSFFRYGYTVDVEYADVTANTCKGDATLANAFVSGGVRYQELASAYDRYANVIFYSLNGQNLAKVGTGEGSVVKDCDNPVVTTTVTATLNGDKLDYTPFIYDATQGNFVSSSGKVLYSYDNISYAEIPYDNGYIFATNTDKETLYIKYVDFKDNANNSSIEKIYTVPIYKLANKMFIVEKADLSGNVKPVFSDNDIIVKSGEKCEFFSVIDPNGREYKTRVLNFNVLGEYQVNYKITTANGSIMYMSRYVEVGDFSAPVITAEDRTIYVGTDLKLNQVECYDFTGYALVVSVTNSKGEEIYTGSVDKVLKDLTADVYTLTYAATDTINEPTVKTVKVTVENPKPIVENKTYTVLVIIAIIFAGVFVGLVVTIIVIKRKKRV